jgi:hypothetical protein
LAPVAAVALLVLFGLAEGLWTHRWVRSAEISTAHDRLEQVPLSIGEWTGRDRELDARQLTLGRIDGYVYRDYVNRVSNEVVSILLLCGQPGPVAVHTPDVCYAGAGYGMVAPAVRRTVASPGLEQPAEFWVGNFRRDNSPSPDPLRIYWGWNATGAWQAAGNPRFAFARYGVLYKLYVIRHLTSINDPMENDPSQKFLEVLLPALQQALFPS